MTAPNIPKKADKGPLPLQTPFDFIISDYTFPSSVTLYINTPFINPLDEKK